MFEIALAIGVFAYLVYFLGLAGLFYSPILIALSVLFWGGFIFWKRLGFPRNISLSTFHGVGALAVFYIAIQAMVNAVGLFGPEIGFDATWYHLTLPKLYLFYHAVLHIPGSVLYYSDMPKLTEMLYAVGLSFGSDFYARAIHFLFGILTCFVVYKLGRKFFSPTVSFLLPVIFYSNLVVGWESISGYIDLSRTFFSSVALLAFFTWYQTKQKKYFFFTGIFVGLTIATKLLALPDAIIYALIFLWIDQKTLALSKRLQRVVIFLLLVFVILSPWMVFSYIHTGNPVYPMFTAYHVGGYWQILNPIFFISSIWNTFGISSDPIHPLFLALLPFFILYARKLWKEQPILTMFTVGGLVAWYITPQTGGGRYILPYLVPLSIVSVWVFTQLQKRWQQLFIFFIAVVAVISIMYRAVAVAKFISVIVGKESMGTFMATHLQYSLGDFYDIDGYFAHHIRPSDTVLLYGFHNLYYIDFPYIDSTWAQKGDKFDYVAVQGVGMPERFRNWNLVYYNTTTQVRLYSLKGYMWQY